MATPNVIGKALPTYASTIFTVPIGTVRHILQVQACNVDGVNDVDVSLLWTSGSTVTYLAYQVTVAAKDSRSLLTGPMVLQNGQSLKALASASGDAEITVTYFDEAM